MKILVIDNYDSFTYNLVHLLKELGESDVDVFRNDKIALEKIANYDKILLSPGPGIPSEAGLLSTIVEKYAHKSILGVCLGHQAIAEVFGARLFNMPVVMHGVKKDTFVVDQEELLFKGLPKKISTGHYHSWSVDTENFSPQLQITAVDESQEIMAIKHKKLDIRGVQFHPESILTDLGSQMIANWLSA